MKISLIIGFILLLAAIGGAFLAGRGNLKLKSAPLLFPKLKTAEVNRIEITKAGETKVMLHSGADWKEETATISAKPETVASALAAVTKLDRKDLVSQNPSKRQIFGLDEKEAMKITLKSDSQILAQFYIGKRAQDYLSNFIRKEGEDKIYLSHEALDQLFTTPLTFQ